MVHALFDKAPWESIDITSHSACNKFACFIFFSNESGLKNSYFHYWISGISPPEMNPFGADARTLTGRLLGRERFLLNPFQSSLKINAKHKHQNQSPDDTEKTSGQTVSIILKSII